MYRGENQEQYIPYRKKDTYMDLGGVVPRVSFFGDPWLQEKGHGMLLGYIKIINSKIIDVLYMGKNV